MKNLSLSPQRTTGYGKGQTQTAPVVNVSLQMKKTKRKKSQMERLIIGGKRITFWF